MKIVSCYVIQDFIPLYLEEMLSEDSKILVETHLDECEECRKYLNELQIAETSPFPVETDIHPLRKIQTTLRKKKWQTIVCSVLITLLIGILTIFFMTAPEYLPYSEKTVSVSETTNGLVLSAFNDEVAGYDIESYPSENGSGSIYHITVWGTSWHDLTNTKEIDPIVLNPSGEKVGAVYYYQADGTQDLLIYGEEQHPNGGVVTLPRLSLAYLSGLAMITFLICIGIMFAVRSNKKHLKRVIAITLFPLSYLLAQLIVTGWNTTTYSATRDFAAILLVTVLLYSLLWIGSKRLKRHSIR
ncbi:zf-HC2 domain-containing protein [Salinicoccus roseus]|uniref:zf-HC2 domain-containing protein n=1 Tax=Salinicoccus roseus TaxID=45670 RepID=UPI00230166AF|nr:zf-HC2 domain-containing protein [Salinicoccus roseus]